MMYVTYKWKLPIWESKPFSECKAIECDNFSIARAVASDIYSLDGIAYVNINKCGRLPKGSTIISYTDYKNGKYYNM